MYTLYQNWAILKFNSYDKRTYTDSHDKKIEVENNRIECKQNNTV